jgi:alanine dehydrogenase
LRIGVAKEIKSHEYRVALTPAGARELVQIGHDVLVETTAGEGSAFPDSDYERAGARMVSVDDVWAQSELLLKVKEPVAAEYTRLREGLVLFTYLHIAADEPLTRALVESGVTAVAYETVETDDHRLPLLAPMSEIAGRLAAQAGAYVVAVREGAAVAGARLDDHLVTLLHELARLGRRQRDAVLVGLDLPGDADTQDARTL